MLFTETLVLRQETIILALVLLAFIIFFHTIRNFRRWRSHGSDLQEKPLVPRNVQHGTPFFGHFWGLYKKSSSYFTYLGRQHSDVPIYRLCLPSLSIYVVTNLSLAMSVHRQYKQFSMYPFVERLAAVVVGISREGRSLIRSKNLTAQFSSRLYPPNAMHDLKCSMIKSVEQKLDELASRCHDLPEPVEIEDLFAWTRRTIIVASTNAFYGLNNPFVKDSLREDFETFERKGLPLMVGFLPRLLGGEGYLARERCAKGFLDFVIKETEGEPQASEMIRRHNDILFEGGLSIEDVARHNLVFSFALTTNSNSAAFWLLFRIYSDSKLLDDLRTELWPLVDTVDLLDVADKTLPPSFRLEVAKLVQSAPLLNSAFHEVLRYYNNHPLSRFVCNDTVIKDDRGQSYLIQEGRGNMLVICQALLHEDEEIWGPGATHFDPYRFLDFLTGARKLPSGAFQGFGGGHHICPGRQLVIAELAAFIAVFVLRFDLTPQNLSGVWTEPGKDHGAFFTSLLPPAKKVPVTITQVDKAVGNWTLGTGADPLRFKLASG